MKYLLKIFLLINIISCESPEPEVVTIGHIGEFDYDIWRQIDEELRIENTKLELRHHRVEFGKPLFHRDVQIG